MVFYLEQKPQLVGMSLKEGVKKEELNLLFKLIFNNAPSTKES